MYVHVPRLQCHKVILIIIRRNSALYIAMCIRKLKYIIALSFLVTLVNRREILVTLSTKTKMVFLHPH